MDRQHPQRETDVRHTSAASGCRCRVQVRGDPGGGDAGQRPEDPEARVRGRRRIRGRRGFRLLRRGSTPRPERGSATPGGRTSSSRSTRPPARRSARLPDGATLIGLISPALNPDLVDELARPPDHRAGDGRGAAHLARAVDGRAQLDGQHRRLPRRRSRPRTSSGGSSPARSPRPARCRRPRSWWPAPEWPVSRRSARPAASARSCARPTPGPRWPTRSARSAASTCRSTSSRRRATDGYAKATSEAYDRRAAEIYAEQAADVDIIITTALIPGRPAPRLITAEDVAAMKPGSVIVDMAAAQGGNVEGTVAGEAVVTGNGVTIIGYTDLAGPAARPGVAAVRHQPGQPDEAADARARTASSSSTSTTSCSGRSPWYATARRPGRRRPSRSRRRPPAAPAETAARRARAEEAAPTAGRHVRASSAVGMRGAVPADRRSRRTSSPRNFTVFVLAVVIGYYVIGKVHHALHTPLMSVTNAISGIIVVGALLQIGHAATRRDRAVVRGDPAGQHQHLRRLRRHPPHARHVLEGLSPMTATTAAQAAYIVAALLFILSLAGLSQHATVARRASSTASPAWRSRWSPPSSLAARDISAHGHRADRWSPWRSAPRSACGGPASSR